MKLNYQKEEAFLSCIAESGEELTRDNFINLIATFSAHFVDSMQKHAPKDVSIKQIYNSYFKSALEFWKEQPRAKYPDLMPSNIGKA